MCSSDLGQKTTKSIFSPFALTLDGERTQFQASISASCFKARYAVEMSDVDAASSYVEGFQSSDVYVYGSLGSRDLSKWAPKEHVKTMRFTDGLFSMDLRIDCTPLIAGRMTSCSKLQTPVPLGRGYKEPR